MQTKITMIYHYIPIKMAKRKKTNHTKCWWKGGETVSHALQIKLHNNFRKRLDTFVIS